MPTSPLVIVQLSSEEALVLFEWLQRFSDSGSTTIEDQAEERALWNLSCLLEQQLTAPFLETYREELAKARARLRDNGLKALINPEIGKPKDGRSDSNFIQFLSRLASGECTREEWELYAVAHYKTEKIELARIEVVRTSIKDEIPPWPTPSPLMIERANTLLLALRPPRGA